jgi:hypothetical protein
MSAESSVSIVLKGGFLDRDELVTFLVNQAGICDCFPSGPSVELMRDLLDVGEMRQLGFHREADECFEDIMRHASELNRSVPIYWLRSIGLIEHNETLLDYDLTDLGDDVLQALRAYGTGEELWLGDEAEPETVAELVGEPDRSLN